MNDTITIDQLHNMSVGTIAALDAGTLAQLLEQASSAVAKAKLTKDLLDGVLNHRYADRAALLRQEVGKDFGSIRFNDDNVTITADLPKRPVWDQQKLAQIAQRIRNAGDNPSEYIDTTLSVSERSYNAWPEQIRRTFESARTVKAGKQVFKLAPKKAEVA